MTHVVHDVEKSKAELDLIIDLCSSDEEDPEVDVDPDVLDMLNGKKVHLPMATISAQQRAEITAAARRYLGTAYNKSLGALASRPTAPVDEFDIFDVFWHEKAPMWLKKYVEELPTQ